jgi:transposase
MNVFGGLQLLIHGARSVMVSLATSATPLGKWLRGLLERMHRNATTVALANKLARIARTVLRRGESFNTAKLA